MFRHKDTKISENENKEKGKNTNLIHISKLKYILHCRIQNYNWTSFVGYVNNVIINNYEYVLIRTCGLLVKLWALFKKFYVFVQGGCAYKH